MQLRQIKVAGAFRLVGSSAIFARSIGAGSPKISVFKGRHGGPRNQLIAAADRRRNRKRYATIDLVSLQSLQDKGNHSQSRPEYQMLFPFARSVLDSAVSKKMPAMRSAAGAIATLVALMATDAAAQVQGVDLNGRYECIAACLGGPGSFAYVTQYGWQLNVIDDAGQPSRAYVDYPGRIWVYRANQGAIYSPDGMTIQFDGGTIWQRALQLPPPPPPPRRR